MKIYVIMGNDFPHSVFSDKAIAEAWCMKNNEIEKQKKSQDVMHRRISWRSYEFTLDAEVVK